MAVLTKDDFFAKLKTLIGDDNSDDTIKILEDFTDTYNSLESEKNDTTNWKEKYENNDKEWRKKYTDRFFNGKSEDNKPDEKEQQGDVPDENTAEDITIDDLFSAKE